MLVSNTQHGTLEAVAVRAPGFGHRRIQHLGDIAAFCGGTVIAEEAGLTLDDVKLEHFGTAGRVIVTADDCTFIEGGGTDEAVSGRLAQLRVELGRAVHDRDVEILSERIARLSAKLAVIRVGAPSVVAQQERFRRTEGALAATQAAMSEGVVPGGGTALLRSRGRAGRVDARGRLRAWRRDRRQRAERAAVLDRLQRRLRRAGRRSTRSARCPTGTA